MGIAALREMRRDAVHAPGYISGKTLRDVADPAHYVIVARRSRGRRRRRYVTRGRRPGC